MRRELSKARNINLILTITLVVTVLAGVVAASVAYHTGWDTGFDQGWRVGVNQLEAATAYDLYERCGDKELFSDSFCEVMADWMDAHSSNEQLGI